MQKLYQTLDRTRLLDVALIILTAVMVVVYKANKL
jgi:hypothetical protein